MQLALRLGMTVAELESRMTCAELTEWLAFFEIEARGGQPQATEDDRRLQERANASRMQAFFKAVSKRKG